MLTEIYINKLIYAMRYATVSDANNLTEKEVDFLVKEKNVKDLSNLIIASERIIKKDKEINISKEIKVPMKYLKITNEFKKLAPHIEQKKSIVMVIKNPIYIPKRILDKETMIIHNNLTDVCNCTGIKKHSISMQLKNTFNKGGIKPRFKWVQ